MYNLVVVAFTPLAGCVGETEFVNGIAAAGLSGIYGNCALCSGIVSTADCLLGAAVLEPILQAHIAGMILS